MRILFFHQNSPGQFYRLARRFAAAGHEVAFLTETPARPIEGVSTVVYPKEPAGETPHRFLREAESGVRHGVGVARAAVQMRQQGFSPDVALGHSGWGEGIYLKDVWPDARLIHFYEFFYSAYEGLGRALNLGLEEAMRVRTKNILNLLALAAGDWGVSPTRFQRDGYPAVWRDRISVVHDGIDTAYMCPAADVLQVDNQGLAFSRDDELVTFSARGLEPVRGFDLFMRALPEILARRPKARALIVGSQQTAYNAPLPDGDTYAARLLRELDGRLDLGRVHWFGQVPYAALRTLFRISSAHLYLTQPFVLSWSLLEAMACGAVVVGARVAPVEEVIRHGDNGFLADAAPEQVAERVVDVLERRHELGEIRRAARETALGYDFEAVCWPRYRRLVEDLLEGRRPAP